MNNRLCVFDNNLRFLFICSLFSTNCIIITYSLNIFDFTEKVFIMSHTILLVQPGIKPETRTYSDYESVNECMEGVCKIYEEHLKRTNPNLPSITYDISQLFEFVDQVKQIISHSFEITIFF